MASGVASIVRGTSIRRLLMCRSWHVRNPFAPVARPGSAAPHWTGRASASASMDHDTCAVCRFDAAEFDADGFLGALRGLGPH
jgi:hypothetical protein